MPTQEEVDEQARTAVVEILQKELRLVSAANGDPCQECGEPLDYTWRIKEGNLEHCARLIVKRLYS